MNYSLSHTINANMLVWCLTVDHCWIVCCLFVFMWWKTAALWLHFASFAVPPMGALCGVGRLLHNPNLAAIGLSVGYETWPSIAWHHTFVIGLWKYRLGLPQSAMDCGLKIPVGIPTILQRPLTVPLHSPNGRLLPAVRAVQGDCEIVVCYGGSPYGAICCEIYHICIGATGLVAEWGCWLAANGTLGTLGSSIGSGTQH